MPQKVLIIILDGARPDVIEKWASAGALPNLQMLINNGTFGELKSVFPIHTMPAFAALMTGKNAGKNGIYDMQLQKPGTYRLIVPNSTNIKSKTMFELASESGKVVGSINIPLTYPPQPINGVTVCSWLTPPFANYTYPKEVSKTLNKMGYKIQPSVLDHGNANFEKEVYETEEKRFEAAKWFMQRYDWSLLAVLITGTEHMHHNYAAFIDPQHPDFLPKQEEIVKKYYSFVDKKIGELLEIIDKDTTVFVISDHGFGPSYGEIYLNNVLQKHGYFKPKQSFSIVRKLFGFLESGGLANRLRNVIKFDLFRLMPRRMRNFINRVISESRAENVNADWEITKAYCTGILGGMRINLADREPEGIVAKEDYERVRDEVVQNLKNDNDIGGLIGRVWKREELYAGPYANEAPDLVVELEQCYTTSPSTPKSKMGNKIIGKWKNVGFHTIQGLLIAYGKDVQSGKRMNAELIDIAPTALHMLDVAVPDDADGKVLKEIFKPDSDVAKRKIKLQKVEKKVEEVERTKEEDEIVKERLRELGYI